MPGGGVARLTNFKPLRPSSPDAFLTGQGGADEARAASSPCCVEAASYPVEQAGGPPQIVAG